MAIQMTDKKLKKDLNRYFRLAKKNFPLRYNSERIEIEDRAFEILNLFERGCLNISGQDYAAWADYINIFGGPDKECLLEKLQKSAGFDVRQYLQNSKRLLPIAPSTSKAKYLPGWRLTLKYRAFRNACKKLRNSRTYNASAYNKASRLHREAEEYLEAFAKGNIKVKNNDAYALRDYFCIMFEVKSDRADKAIQSLTRTIRQNEANAGKFSLSVIRAKNKFRHATGKIKISMLAVLAAAGSLIGLKSCDKPLKFSLDKEIASTLPSAADNNIATPGAKTISFAEAQKGVPSALSSASKDDREQKIWNNYYDNTLDILISAPKKEALYKQIEAQIEKKILVLPQGVSKQKLAYCYAIYNEYGIKSSIADALNSTEKLSEARQNRLAEDIKAAGSKGQGVKAMAQKINRGQLKQTSKFDRADKVLRLKHIQNLNQLMKLAKQAAHSTYL